MTKVGFVTTPLTSGHTTRGIGFYTRHLLRHLKKQSQDFGIEIVEIQNNPLPISAGIARRHNLQLIHYPFFDPFSHTLPIFKPAKTVVTIHDLIPLEFPDHYPPGIHGQINFQLQKLALLGVGMVITDSYSSVQAVYKYLHIPQEKIKFVYLAADDIYMPLKNKMTLEITAAKYHLPNKFILYVGDINFNKNIPSLVKACAKLNIPLVLVGTQAAQIDRLDLSHPELSHLKGVNFQDTIRPGFVSDPDLRAVYNLATVYCQASFTEGFGLPVLEALSCGTPVACSQSSSLPEVAQTAAEYFDPYKVNDLILCLKKLIKSHKRIVPSHVSQFSWTNTARLTLQVYQELL